MRPLLLCLTAALVPLATLALPPTADSKPAVKALNGRVVGAFEYQYLGKSTETGGFTIQKTDTLFGGAGGILTVPILHRLGGRVFVSGGEQETLQDGFSSFAQVAAGGSLFVRDPEVGYLDLGYRFRWIDPSIAFLGEVDEHALTAGAGIYFPDLGAGPVDWEVFFVYARDSVDAPTFDDHADAYQVGAELGWYVADALRLALGFDWQQRSPKRRLCTSSYLGLAELQWLVPTGKHRFVTLGIFGGGGRLDYDLPAPLSSISQAVAQAGFNVTFSYPGARSLRELMREYY